MNSFKDLKIYQLAYDISIRAHKASLKLPNFEIHEQGGQIRRSTKSIKDSIAEGFGRRRYKAEFVRFLIYAQGSCDEAHNQAETIIDLYPNIPEFSGIMADLDKLGKMINNFTRYVESNWKTF